MTDWLLFFAALVAIALAGALIHWALSAWDRRRFRDTFVQCHYCRTLRHEADMDWIDRWMTGGIVGFVCKHGCEHEKVA